MNKATRTGKRRHASFLAPKLVKKTTPRHLNGLNTRRAVGGLRAAAQTHAAFSHHCRSTRHPIWVLVRAGTRGWYQEGSGKPMSRALRSGAVRIFRHHQGQRGWAFDQHFKALAKRFGPFDEFTRHYASSVAALFIEFRSASEALQDAQRQRQVGKGRRPNQLAINRLQKRAGLCWQSYDAALQRLEDLCHQKPSPTRPPTREELMAEMNG